MGVRLVGERLAFRILDVDGGDGGALADELVDRGGADASRASRDDDLLAFEQVLSFKQCQTHDDHSSCGLGPHALLWKCRYI